MYYNRQVTTDEGVKLAKDNEAIFAEVSARLGSNIQELFTNLASTLPGSENNQAASKYFEVRRENLMF